MKTTIEIALPELTPEHFAVIFWNQDDAWQGRFFDELGALVMATPAPFTKEIGSMYGLDWQMYMAGTKATPLGRDAMSRFEANGKPLLAPHRNEIQRDYSE
jgi:hypothetical protein